MIIKLTEGLGDCLIAGACIQELAKLKNEKITFITNSLLKPIFAYHPLIQYQAFPIDNNNINLRWVSQLRLEQNINLYGLHTSQRFSTQLGFYIEPSVTLDIYDENKNIIKNNKSTNLVVINTHSAEHTRRFIPQRYIDYIENICHNLNLDVIFIGNCIEKQSIMNIEEQIEILKICKFFIGPISFSYHLASALKTKSLLFCSYMPYYKFSDFINTEHIYSSLPCTYRCEEFETENRTFMNCFAQCKAIEYDFESIERKIKKLIND